MVTSPLVTLCVSAVACVPVLVSHLGTSAQQFAGQLRVPLPEVLPDLVVQRLTSLGLVHLSSRPLRAAFLHSLPSWVKDSGPFLEPG